MNATHLLAAVGIGLGATLMIDLWAVFLKRAFAVNSLNYCLLGRWVLYMPQGKFAHASIAASASKPHECMVGWAAHYSIGVAFGLTFVWIASPGWLASPTLLPALAFGVATVVVPFFTLQPALGLGIASSRQPRPAAARIKSLATHTVFGLGLWVCAYLQSRVF